jgi:hypothetical protein
MLIDGWWMVVHMRAIGSKSKQRRIQKEHWRNTAGYFSNTEEMQKQLL